MIAHGTRDSTSANSGGIDGRDGGGGNSNSTWAGPEDNSASEHVLALRSGDIKTMTESAKYVHEAIAHELRRVRKGSRGLKSPSSNVYSYLGAILDCLACVGSHPAVLYSILTVTDVSQLLESVRYPFFFLLGTLWVLHCIWFGLLVRKGLESRKKEGKKQG
mmetsp:Transcript_18191/g.29634  ORF Transcript_18191/g.29634 Transcript_18191/m.29634 type:complete len:162 (-) Transcript_18191:273-758(-)